MTNLGQEAMLAGRLFWLTSSGAKAYPGGKGMAAGTWGIWSEFVCRREAERGGCSGADVQLFLLFSLYDSV